MRRIPLFTEKIGPVCKPERLNHFIKGQGKEASLRDSAVLLHSATRPYAWRDWANSQGMSLAQQPQQHFEHFYFCLQAAISGGGMAIVARQYVCHDITAGLLIAPFGFKQDGSNYCLLTPQKVAPGSALEKVIAWLQPNDDP